MLHTVVKNSRGNLPHERPGGKGIYGNTAVAEETRMRAFLAKGGRMRHLAATGGDPKEKSWLNLAKKKGRGTLGI